MAALQQVQIVGIQIEWFASVHEVEDSGAVFKHGMSQNDIGV
jgi:hypothetical protein